MRNKSIFQGVKELGEFTFIDNGLTWAVYREADDCRFFFAHMRKIPRESNAALYERAKNIDAPDCQQ